MADLAALRARRLLWGLLAAAVLAVLTALVAARWGPLGRLDHAIGRRPELLTSDHRWVFDVARVVAHVTMPMVWVLVVLAAAGVLWTRNHVRAAAWTSAVGVTSWVLGGVLKSLVDRPRPTWPHPVEVLHSASFPSGHATQAAATAGIAIVLTRMLVRRRALRRLAIVLAAAFALAVGVDRVLLGVHHASDVVAGYALGAAVVLLSLVVYDPTPRSIALTNAPLPDAMPASERILAAVLNPIKVDDVDDFKSLVETMARDAGWSQVLWFLTTEQDTGHGMAHRAAVEGASLVLTIGGDGTVRAVCEELAGTGVPVGIVPAGTGNLLARNLDVPLYLRAAVDVALNGQDRAVDMVEVSGDAMDDAVFLVMAGMGFDAAIMEGVNDQIKAKVGWLAYVWSALKSLMFPAMKVEISVDDGPFTEHRARTLVIGNVGFLQAGMPLLPDAAIDDGVLDVVLLYPRRFLSWVPLAARVLTRSHRTDETVNRMTGRTVVVRAAKEEPRQLDGDLIGAGRELHARCVHGRLLVRVPR